jgi:hypothetical protein
MSCNQPVTGELDREEAPQKAPDWMRVPLQPHLAAPLGNAIEPQSL